MRYTVRRSLIWVLGYLWMPHAPASTVITLSPYDLGNMRDDDGRIDRDAVEQWLTSHSGDFSSVTDFAASIENGADTITIPWLSEDNEMTYYDTLGEDA